MALAWPSTPNKVPGWVDGMNGMDLVMGRGSMVGCDRDCCDDGGKHDAIPFEPRTLPRHNLFFNLEW